MPRRAKRKKTLTNFLLAEVERLGATSKAFSLSAKARWVIERLKQEGCPEASATGLASNNMTVVLPTGKLVTHRITMNLLQSPLIRAFPSREYINVSAFQPKQQDSTVTERPPEPALQQEVLLYAPRRRHQRPRRYGRGLLNRPIHF